MLVSIITVCYNSAHTIRKAIEFVLNQTYPNIEYTIVDGLSKDETAEIAKSYADAFRQKGYTHRVISEKDNGIYDAMNKGITKETVHQRLKEIFQDSDVDVWNCTLI